MTVCSQCGRELSPSRAVEATDPSRVRSPTQGEHALSAAPHTALLTRRTPVPLTAVLVGINVLIFLAMVLKGASVDAAHL